ncbi:MAG: type II secretion system protein [Nitrospinota bacterium]
MAERKDAAHEKGFTLIELIMIIVLVGVVFPAILAPFMQSARQTATPANISSLTMVARGNMEIVMDDLCDTTGAPPTLNWPAASYVKNIPADTTANINNVSYTTSAGNLNFTTTINGQFYPSDLSAPLADPPSNDGYLVISLTTTINGTSDSVTLQSVKSKSYTSGKCS